MVDGGVHRASFPLVGSFQRGRVIEASDPLSEVWRRIERAGTIDNLRRVIANKGRAPDTAEVASLRLQQAVEFRSSARSASLLTKPLLLYYSSLNLVRAVSLAYTGDAGAPSHGLSFTAGADILSCQAVTLKKGTFPKFASDIGVEDLAPGACFSLRDILASVPELLDDFPLLACGESSIVRVAVHAFINADTKLRFFAAGFSEDEFRERWEDLHPWFRDSCEYAESFTLRLKERLTKEDDVAAFCKQKLLHHLTLRDDPLWYDHVTRPGVQILHRLLAYLAGLFVLSNVVRYQPEFLATATRGNTDAGYALDTFLRHAERYVPQLILELLNGHAVFFRSP